MFKDDVDADWKRCYQLGVTGVPTFLIDGSVAVERKMGEPDRQSEIILQFLNTPGTEIAPGSNVIRKDL